MMIHEVERVVGPSWLLDSHWEEIRRRATCSVRDSSGGIEECGTLEISQEGVRGVPTPRKFSDLLRCWISEPYSNLRN